MKKFLLGVVASLLITSAGLHAVNSPFDPWIKLLTGDVTYNDAGSASLAASSVATAEILDGTILEADISASATEGLGLQRLAVFDYDFAEDGGAIGAIATGVTLPANSVIDQCYFRVETQLVDAGSGTLAVSCEDANNIFSAADFTGNTAGSIVAGAPLGTIATMVDDIAAACDITYTIAGAALTAGKIRGYCKYSVHE